jgi:hypothetical protein
MQKQTKVKDMCRGCTITELRFYNCLYITTGLEEECPCIECLIKPMCVVVCDVRIKSYKELFNNRYFIPDVPSISKEMKYAKRIKK